MTLDSRLSTLDSRLSTLDPANVAYILCINHISPLSLRPLILAGALLLLCLSSCSRVHSIREARTIVAEADSLRSAGQSLSPSAFHLSTSKSDSTTIASAVSALEPLRLIYPTDYAHANYYYGRLLREAGNQPEAMLAFLRVIHSRTKDYAIKGRAYSNMGTMCNYSGEFALSYDMYGHSAEHFWKAKESTLYYYAQNAKALQLAELSLHDETLQLLDSITNNCNDSGVLAKTWETKTFLYINLMQYDSALYAIRMLHAAGYRAPSVYVKQAQAFWYLEQYDSAHYYAQYVMSMPQATPRDKYNMLYILTFNDPDITDPEFKERYEERADIDKEILDPQNMQYSQAMDLLEQDLTRKPNLTWLWTLLVTLCIIATSTSIYIRKKKAKHQLISQQTEQLLLKNEQLVQQTTLLKQQHTLRREKMRQELEFARLSICNAHDWQKELHWKNYDEMCEILNAHFLLFADKLKATTALDEKEIRLCVLVFLDMFTLKQIADILSYSETGIRTYKSRVNEKFGNKGHDLRNFLIENVILGASEEQEM